MSLVNSGKVGVDLLNHLRSPLGYEGRVDRPDRADQPLGLLDNSVGTGSRKDFLHPLQCWPRLGVPFQFQRG